MYVDSRLNTALLLYFLIIRIYRTKIIDVKLKLCSSVNLASSRLCLPSGFQPVNGQGITNHSYNNTSSLC